MIVLDEQLMGRGIEQAIAAWYLGVVRFISELRPGSVIKDDAVPSLLSPQDRPTFVTINETDVWRKVAISPGFCVVCIALPDSRAAEIPALLRALLSRSGFRSRAARMGKVVRLSASSVSYYSAADTTVRAG